MYAARNVNFVSDGVVRQGGVPDAPADSACPWPQKPGCNGSYAQPKPEVAEAFYEFLFTKARVEMGMVAFEQDFVGQNSMGFGWPKNLREGSEWLRGMGAAAAKVGTHALHAKYLLCTCLTPVALLCVP